MHKLPRRTLSWLETLWNMEKKEKEITKIKFTQNISFPEARKIV